MPNTEHTLTYGVLFVFLIIMTGSDVREHADRVSTHLVILRSRHCTFFLSQTQVTFMSRPIAISLIAIGLFVFTFLQLYRPIHSHPIQQSNRAMKRDLLPRPAVKGELVPQPKYPLPSSPCTLEAHCRRV
jgi:hypothetical protein